MDGCKDAWMDDMDDRNSSHGPQYPANGGATNLRASVDSGGVRGDTLPVSNGSPHDHKTLGDGSPAFFHQTSYQHLLAFIQFCLLNSTLLLLCLIYFSLTVIFLVNRICNYHDVNTTVVMVIVINDDGIPSRGGGTQFARFVGWSSRSTNVWEMK